MRKFIAHRQNVINNFGERGDAVKRLTQNQVAGSPPHLPVGGSPSGAP